MGLSTTKHPAPYRLKWLDEQGGQYVRRQCLVNLGIGFYKDQILCDVLNMDACHILLGRPWQHDRKAVHDGYNNVYTIKDQGKKKDLLPLPPSKTIPPPKVKQANLSTKEENFEAKGGVQVEVENVTRAITTRREVLLGKKHYQVGDFVFVDWKKGKYGSQAKKYKNKLMEQSMGPFEVIERRGEDHYCVELGKDPRVLAIFYKDALTPYHDEDLQNLRSNSFEEGEDEPCSSSALLRSVGLAEKFGTFVF